MRLHGTPHAVSLHYLQICPLIRSSQVHGVLPLPDLLVHTTMHLLYRTAHHPLRHILSLVGQMLF